MSVEIDTVTVASVEDRRLVLANAQAARVIDIGTSWTRIRIGLRLAFDDSGANLTGTPRFYVGMLSSPSAGMANGPLTGSTSHFVGYISGTASWVRGTGGGGIYYTVPSTNSYAKKIGSTISTVAGSATSQAFSAQPATRRPVFLVEVVKGSPNFTVNLCIYSAAVAPPVDIPLSSTLASAMEISSLVGAAAFLSANYVGTLTGSLAVDEATNGFLNAVCVAWDRTTPALHISDFYWAKMA